jgi:hypothetical protein
MTMLRSCEDSNCANNDNRSHRCKLIYIELVRSYGRSTDYVDELVCHQRRTRKA